MTSTAIGLGAPPGDPVDGALVDASASVTRSAPSSIAAAPDLSLFAAIDPVPADPP
jgi:hypothetical protein